jgi:hypothetical protein
MTQGPGEWWGEVGGLSDVKAMRGVLTRCHQAKSQQEHAQSNGQQGLLQEGTVRCSGNLAGSNAIVHKAPATEWMMTHPPASAATP